jgi:hypothetical protein
MKTQNYENHRRFDPAFHVVLFFTLLLTWIGAGVNLWKSLGDHTRLYSAALLFVLTAAVLLLTFICRIYALRAQDRAIRAEENLRHYLLAGKLLDPRLGVKQIVALRFAGDGEYVELARKAANEAMAPDAIKRAVKEWRADDYRV